MILSIDSMKQAGAFVGAPVCKDITWTHNGEEHTATVYVRKMSYKTAMADLASVHANLDLLAGRIADAICDEKGKPIFTPGDITGDADPERGALCHELTMALLNVIAEVNGLGKK